MDDGVRTLDVRIRAPAARLDAVAAPARAATVRVLERAAALVEARAPGRVLLVRELPIAIRIRESGLTDDAELEAVAVEIADALDQTARACRTPSPGDDAVVFASVSQWQEAFRASAGTLERKAWYFEAMREEVPDDRSGEFAPPDDPAEIARAALAGTLEASLVALASDELHAFAVHVAAHVDAADPEPTAPLPLIAGGEVIRGLRLGLALAHAERARRDRPGDSREELVARGAPAVLREMPVLAGEATGLGGLFYLLTLALELGLGELLWQACLPEGPTLGRALACLVDEEDSALGTIAGGALVPAPRITEAQREDIAPALFAAVLAALPRRGLAVVPELHLELASSAVGRVLVVAGLGSPFILFALPAREDADVAVALSEVVAAAGGVPISASPALAALDRSGRVRARSPRVRCALPETADPLLAQIAGSLAILLAARAGMTDIASARELVERVLRLRGRIVHGSATIHVLLDGNDVDLDVRRAGLDADPGWVPWLERHVTLEFVER